MTLKVTSRTQKQTTIVVTGALRVNDCAMESGYVTVRILRVYVFFFFFVVFFFFCFFLFFFSIFQATEEIIKRTFDRPLDNTTMSDYLLTDAYFLKFCRVLLTFGLYLKNFKQILCPHTHSQIHFQPRYKFWLEDNNSEQVSISDMEREKQLYSELQKHYRRFEVPSFRGDWLPYQVEAYANRLLVNFTESNCEPITGKFHWE